MPDLHELPTQPPPPMPRMTPRDDSPRLVTRPGAESRYWRARASLEQQLTASIAIADAVARIAVVPSRSYDPSAAACPCGGDESERLDDGESVLDLAIAIPLRRVRCCSVRCAACELLWQLHETQDQSAVAVLRVSQMIERASTARVMVPAVPQGGA